VLPTAGLTTRMEERFQTDFTFSPAARLKHKVSALLRASIFFLKFMTRVGVLGNQKTVTADFETAPIDCVFASGHQRPSMDTLQRPSLESLILMSFALRRLTFVFDWSQSCGGQA